MRGADEDGRGGGGEDETTGRTLLYFSSGRPGGLGLLDIYVSELESDKKGDFGSPSPVPELNTTSTDYQPALSKDGLELFFVSNRPGGIGNVDLWGSTREDTGDHWSAPFNLGKVVNSIVQDFHPTLSFDRTTLFFASDRTGGVGSVDLWMSTRSKVRGRN